MKFDIDDARLTAYLLDEVDESERAEVEALLAENAEARDFVASMGRITEALGAELSPASLSDSPGPELGELRMARIAKAAAGGSKRRIVAGIALAAAAAAVVALVVGAFDEPQRKDEPVVKMTLDSIDQEVPTPRPQPPVTTPTTTTELARSRNTQSNTGSVDSNGVPKPPPAANTEIDDETRRQLEALGYFGGDVDFDTPAYDEPASSFDNDFVAVRVEPLSTFSIDVDTASYSQMRQSLRTGGYLPSPDSVRIEEFINYFDYDYPSPSAGKPFGVVTEVNGAPWNTQHKLVRIGIKARTIKRERRPRANLVFLLDVSGSMRDKDKLPLLKRSLEMLLAQLDAEDRIAIVVYAGASGLALPSTSVANKDKILGALKRLNSGGGTNGGAGIELAYRVAQENFVEGGVNRVILATDGDFNVGTTSRSELTKLIEAKAKNDVFLTVLGFGIANTSDGTMEQLADKGNGNYAFIDTLAEAKKVLVDQVEGTLVAVAKDVKLQVEFNPKRVSAYRLIGYENRVLANEDFNNDAVDAGDIGAGHTVTALYEIVPPEAAKVDSLRYQTTTTTSAGTSGELLTIKLRYKEPTGSNSMKQEIPVFDAKVNIAASSVNFKFASAVAAFGMILRRSPHGNGVTLSQVLDWATEGRGDDPHEYRAEFLQLVRKAKKLRR